MKLRLTKAGRAVLFIAIIVVLGVGGFFGYQHFAGDGASLIDQFQSDKLPSNDTNAGVTDTAKPNNNTAQNIDTRDRLMVVSLVSIF